ncbi:hypothetical protein DRO53_00160 [Candidatus Bathyarchaeota archaeon]|nr:MAG: hypothetical protein DRO53_00160 [Candidatus Bathyarchaeota archaeon]
MKIKIGLPSNLFPWLTLEESFLKVVDLKPEAIEIVLDKPHVSLKSLFEPDFAEKLKNMVSMLPRKLELSIHAPFQEVNPASPNPAGKMEALKIFRESLKLTALIGGKVMVVHPGWLTPPPKILFFTRKVGLIKARRRLRSLLAELSRQAESLNVKVGLENVHGELSLFRLPREAHHFPEAFYTFDIGHAYIEARRKGKEKGEAEKWLASQLLKAFKGKLAHIHLHDNRGLNDGHAPPGEGEINFKPFIEALEKLSFQGQVIVEVWKPENPEVAGLKALKAARQLFR